MSLRYAFMVFLLFSCAGGALALPLPADKVPAFCIPKMSHPPTMNGTINPDEWKEAVAVSGLAQQNPGGNLLIMRPTTYYLGWDADNLYLACRTWIMPGYKPHVSGRAPNTASAFDDGMEFNLKPLGENVPGGRRTAPISSSSPARGPAVTRCASPSASSSATGSRNSTWPPALPRSVRRPGGAAGGNVRRCCRLNRSG